MKQEAQKKTLDAIRRMEGLAARLREMVGSDAYCPKILEIALAMQGQLKCVQSAVLENHLHTCAGKKLASKDKSAFIAELLKVIGLSTR